jgi:hypothetical protein
MEKSICPKCRSKNVRKQDGYAAVKYEGQPAGEERTAPNYCLEEKCLHEWYDKT